MDNLASLSILLAEMPQRIAMVGEYMVHDIIKNKVLIMVCRGPGFQISDFESNRLIAQKQVDGAHTLMSQSLAQVQGPVTFVHTYMNMYVCSIRACYVCIYSPCGQVLPIVPASERHDCTNMSPCDGYVQ